jgi:hypothetical protein
VTAEQLAAESGLVAATTTDGHVLYVRPESVASVESGRLAPDWVTPETVAEMEAYQTAGSKKV